MSEEKPLNVIDRVKGVQAIIEDCVICGDTHYHGHAWNVHFLEGGVRQERGAHCRNGAYDIMIDESTDVPDDIVERAKAKRDPDRDDLEEVLDGLTAATVYAEARGWDELADRSAELYQEFGERDWGGDRDE